MFAKKRRLPLRDRFLAEQQLQLMEDAKLPDPAEAYRALLDELDREEPREGRHADRAA